MGSGPCRKDVCPMSGALAECRDREWSERALPSFCQEHSTRGPGRGKLWNTALGTNLHISTDGTGPCGQASSVSSRTKGMEGGRGGNKERTTGQGLGVDMAGFGEFSGLGRCIGTPRHDQGRFCRGQTSRGAAGGQTHWNLGGCY